MLMHFKAPGISRWRVSGRRRFYGPKLAVAEHVVAKHWLESAAKALTLNPVLFLLKGHKWLISHVIRIFFN